MINKLLTTTIFLLLLVGNAEATTYSFLILMPIFFASYFITYPTGVAKSKSKIFYFMKIFLCETFYFLANITHSFLISIIWLLSWMLQSQVCCLMWKKLQILNSIIIFNPINMVHNFFLGEVSTDRHFNNKTMFFYHIIFRFKRMAWRIYEDISIAVLSSPFKMPRLISFNKLTFRISHIYSFLFLCIITFYSSTVNATVFYVRTDGSNATNCDGETDAAYDGSGTGEACALNSPHWVFPSRGESTAKAAANGDTVIIKSGSYRVGCQDATDCRDSNVNLTQSAYCHPSWPYDCYMGVVPSNVTIVGCSLDGCADPSQRPEIWGAGQIGYIFNVSSSTGVTIKDIEITDHDDCGSGHPAYSCGGSDSSELSANDGIYTGGSVATRATNLLIDGVKIHGLRVRGIFGNYSGLTLRDSVVNYNAIAGMDSDSCYGAGTCPNAGTNTFQRSEIKFNGCVEDNPGYGTPKANGCYTQGQGGGYGDGLGAGATVGTWIFEDMDISHNTSDGLDLLYHDGSASITIERSRFEGNNGQAVKVPQTVYIEDSHIIGNCGYFYGQSFTCSSAVCGNAFDTCRASGNTLAISFKSGNSTNPRIYSSTLLSNGDVGIEASGTCTTGIDTLVKNSILLGGRQFRDDTGLFASGGNDTSSIYYDAGTDGNGANCNSDFVEDYNICYGWKEGSSSCNGTNSTDTVDPLFSGTIKQGPYSSPGYYTTSDYIDQLTLQAGSTARDKSDETLSDDDALDYNSYDRGAAWDAGAFEYGTVSGTAATCGNNVKESGEVCDGTDLNSQTCVTQGFTSGTLTCHANCLSFVTSSCVTTLCGNSNIDPNEDCDTANLNSQTCVSQGYASGTLACSSCAFDYTGCVALACGNGTIDAGEQCDDSNTTNSDGCSAICQTEVSGLEKLLLYTEGDSGSVLTPTTHKVTVNGSTISTNDYLRYDYGASYFGDFVHRFKTTIDECLGGGSGNGYTGSVWALTASARTGVEGLQSGNDGVYLYLYCESDASVYRWGLYNAADDTSDTFNDSAPVLVRYVEMERSGGTTTAKIYSDENYTTLLDTLTVSGNSTAFRYVYPFISYNGGAIITDLNSNCLGGWWLNDNAASSTVTDSCSYGETGTLKANATSINTSTVTTTGKLNSAFTFNGTTNERNVDLGDNFEFSRTTPFSVEAWVKTSAASEQSIISKLDCGCSAGCPGWAFEFTSSGALQFLLISNISSNWMGVATSTTGYNDNNWKHVVVTYDGSSNTSGVTFYVNGSSSAKGTAYANTLSNAITYTNYSASIGARTSCSDRNTEWDGLLDNVRVFDRVLSSSEVTSLYNAGAGVESISGISMSGSVENLDLDAGSGAPASTPSNKVGAGCSASSGAAIR